MVEKSKRRLSHRHYSYWMNYQTGHFTCLENRTYYVLTTTVPHAFGVDDILVALKLLLAALRRADRQI